MFIRLVSDLHLEFSNKFILPELDEDAESILVLAGDICEIDELHKGLKFFDNVCSRFKYVIYVFGNHEYYDGSINRAEAKFLDSVKHANLFLLQNKSIILDDVVFIGSTLWSDFEKGSPLSMWNCECKMRDFKHIRCGSAQEPYKMRWKPVMAAAMHERNKKYILNECNANKDKVCVVVTHHAPSTLSISDNFKASDVNGGYVSDLSELIFEGNPKLWMHGHLHETFDYQLYNSRILCNPKGYPIGTCADGSEWNENLLFDPLFRIEL